jgi:hypothetical protein
MGVLMAVAVSIANTKKARSNCFFIRLNLEIKVIRMKIYVIAAKIGKFPVNSCRQHLDILITGLAARFPQVHTINLMLSAISFFI